MRFFFFSSRRRHTRFSRDWSSDVCSSDLCWAVALITVGITGWALVVWIGRYEPVEQNAAANRRATGWRQPFLRTVAWINRQGPWVTAVASIAIAVVSLTLARQSNEGAYRELSRSL